MASVVDLAAMMSTSISPIPCGVAWLMNRVRQVGASES